MFRNLQLQKRNSQGYVTETTLNKVHIKRTTEYLLFFPARQNVAM